MQAMLSSFGWGHSWRFDEFSYIDLLHPYIQRDNDFSRIILILAKTRETFPNFKYLITSANDEGTLSTALVCQFFCLSVH